MANPTSVSMSPGGVGETALVLVTYERPPASNLLNVLDGKVEWVILVDNSTTPAVQDQIDASSKALKVRHLVIHNSANLGMARALNIGIESARAHGCDFVFLLDGDATVEPDFFQTERECLATLERANRVNPGVVVPIVTDATPSREPPLVRGDWTAVRSIITSGVFARISTFQAVGGFNESLFVEGVDFDFASRVRASGRTLVRINRVLVRQLFGTPIQPAYWADRWLELLYTGFYYAGILMGRSNSFHTRLSSYSLERREELVRSYRSARPAGWAGVAARAFSWFGLLSQLLVDSLASRDQRYLQLAFKAT